LATPLPLLAFTTTPYKTETKMFGFIFLLLFKKDYGKKIILLFARFDIEPIGFATVLKMFQPTHCRAMEPTTNVLV